MTESFTQYKSGDFPPADVHAYCQRRVRSEMEGWQFAQALDALRRFGQETEAGCVSSFEWNGRLAEAHPAVRMLAEEEEARGGLSCIPTI